MNNETYKLRTAQQSPFMDDWHMVGARSVWKEKLHRKIMEFIELKDSEVSILTRVSWAPETTRKVNKGKKLWPSSKL